MRPHGISVLQKVQGTRQRPRHYNTGLNTVTVTIVNCLQTHRSWRFIVQLLDHQEDENHVLRAAFCGFVFITHDALTIIEIAEVQQAYLSPRTSITDRFVDSAKSQKLLGY